MLAKTLNRLRPQDIKKLLQHEGSHNDGGSLYLVVRRKGSGAWVFKFRDGAVLRSKGLGALPDVTLAMARKKRADELKSHEDEPEKPKAKGLPFEVLAEQYFDHHTEIGAAQITRSRALLRLYAGPLMKRSVNRITRQEVADVLRPIWLGSSNGKGMKLRALIERVLNSADNERNPATWARLQSLLPARSKKTRKSVKVASLPYCQLPAIYAELTAVGEGPGLTAARVLRFLILTSVRLKEGRGARLSEIDYDKKLWTIPAERMKIKEEGDFEVPLSDQALAVLREMQDDMDGDLENDGFIFPGRWSHQCIGRNAVSRLIDCRVMVIHVGLMIGGARSRRTALDRPWQLGLKSRDRRTVFGCSIKRPLTAHWRISSAVSPEHTSVLNIWRHGASWRVLGARSGSRSAAITTRRLCRTCRIGPERPAKRAKPPRRPEALGIEIV